MSPLCSWKRVWQFSYVVGVSYVASPQHEGRHSDPSLPILLAPNVKVLGAELPGMGRGGGVAGRVRQMLPVCLLQD